MHFLFSANLSFHDKTLNACIQISNYLFSGKQTGIVYDDVMTLHHHLFSKAHPERPNRIIHTMDVLKETKLLSQLKTVLARDVTMEEVRMKQ